ncbi:MAG: bifunctional diaminohydroxyphosphoribosylaminopyrimidine deaminase/5-amino-6-(5-phosphoribosylamino)uracil reductase RibD [Deltaproteobacteria bacterium]|nr:MAG: bifunctional diaminohydroxyphosphoribosylaminopyrimidine deaminase/5-amino-6-(5-phosphoribosylamino)uracil reductase RibD [Deltaproteobacteria bacterium]
MESRDLQLMRRALELAGNGEGRTRPNPPVGAVLVRDNAVIGEGWHQRAGMPHAEIEALLQAGEGARGADIYVTLEPCSHTGRTGPCARALIEAGVKRVVVGALDPNPQVAGRGVAMLEKAGVEVKTGILEEECSWLIGPFRRHILNGRPLVTLKAAITLDGATATSHGESQWISCEESRLDVHRFRDRVDAIMVGVGTVLRDNPRLNTRLPEGGGRDPVRVVVDSRLRMPADAAMLMMASEVPTFIATTPEAPGDKRRELERAGAEIIVCDEIEGQGVDLAGLLDELGRRDLMHLMLEGGASLNHSMLRAGLVDRLRLYLAPRLFGGSDARGLFSGPDVGYIRAAHRLRYHRVERMGCDLVVDAEFVPCSPD